MACQQSAEAAQRAAIAELRAVRDRVAALEPPPMGGDRLGVSWQALASWAARTSGELTTERERISATRAEVAASADAADAAARKVVAELLGVATAPLPELRDQLVTAAATTVADLAGPSHCPAVRATASLAPMLAE